MILHKVLILPIGTEIGLEIYRALKYSKHFKVYGISSDDNNHGRFLCGEDYINENIPTFDSPDFWKYVAQIVKKYKIDFIYPASPLLFDVLEKVSIELKDKLVLTDFITVSLCRSKFNTYKAFTRYLNVPKEQYITYCIDNNTETTVFSYPKFPCFLKPDKGQGTNNSYKINNKTEFDAFYNYSDAPLILEYIDGPEYTVDCFTDRFGELRVVLSRIRNRIKTGISVNTSIVDNKRFKPIAETINSTLNMRGGWFFQVKGNDKLYLLEIEPRIAGTSGIWRQIGVNLPLLTLYDRLEQDVEIAQLDHSIELDRALKARFKTDVKYNNVYVDLDDTLIINNRVNTQLVSFLYQCFNNDKRICLLTRNDRVFEKLKKHSICRELFNEINILNLDIPKSSHINHFPAIFIDDSFGERQEVKQKLNIPVFDLDAVECLRGVNV